MKFGFSLLLSETLEAVRLGYEDCRQFQIVCPICREPILKAVREQTHYLSHYPAAASYAADCELRVSSFNVSDIERQNSESRGQRLALFLRVLRDGMMQRDYPDQGKAAQLFRLLERSKALQTLYREFATSAQHFDEHLFHESVDFYINKDIGTDSAMFRTGFGISMQKRIAYDIWRSLMTPPQEPNRRFVFHSGYAMLLWRLQLSFEGATQPQRRLRNYAERLIETNRVRGMALLKEMACTPAPYPFAEPGSTYLVKLLAETTHEAIGALVRLDYLHILQRHQAA